MPRCFTRDIPAPCGWDRDLACPWLPQQPLEGKSGLRKPLGFHQSFLFLFVLFRRLHYLCKRLDRALSFLSWHFSNQKAFCFSLLVETWELWLRNARICKTVSALYAWAVFVHLHFGFLMTSTKGVANSVHAFIFYWGIRDWNFSESSLYYE